MRLPEAARPAYRGVMQGLFLRRVIFQVVTRVL
jgi:hypothetical protein